MNEKSNKKIKNKKLKQFCIGIFCQKKFKKNEKKTFNKNFFPKIIGSRMMFIGLICVRTSICIKLNLTKLQKIIQKSKKPFPIFLSPKNKKKKEIKIGEK
jgi:hypothetical protein